MQQKGTLWDAISHKRSRLSKNAFFFQYIHENFTNAPSMDLSPATLDMLVHLMCAQARECLFEKAELGVADCPDEVGAVEECLVVGQEAAHVSDVYGKVHVIMSEEGQQDYVPFSWVALAQVKKEHYRYNECRAFTRKGSKLEYISPKYPTWQIIFSNLLFSQKMLFHDT